MGPPERRASLAVSEEVSDGGAELARNWSLGSEYQRYKRLTRSLKSLQAARTESRRSTEPILGSCQLPRTRSCDLPASSGARRSSEPSPLFADSKSTLATMTTSEDRIMAPRSESSGTDSDGESSSSSSFGSSSSVASDTALSLGGEEDNDSEDEFDPEILRGVPLPDILRGAGNLWRTSPIDRDPKEQQEIYGASQKCQHLDAFISQTWQTSGWQRYLALLVQYYWRRAALAGLSANMALFLLDLAGRLPTFKVSKLASDFPVDIRASPWSPIPAVVSLASLILGPWIRRRADPTVFFDAACINQTDKKAKVKGVYNLKEFLEMSSELIVLWSPEYLQRMWCAYELALYSAKKDMAKVTIIPVVQQKLSFFLFCATGLTALLQNVARTLSPRCARGAESKIWAYLGSLLLVRFYMPYVRDIQRLSEQFDSFDIRQAQCRESFDRMFVTGGIIEQYGSEDDFNQYVQGPLKSKVMAAVPPLGMTYKQLLGATASFSVFLASQSIASLARARISRSQFVRASLTWIVHLGVVYPMCFKLHFMAIPFITRRCRGEGSEWACSAAIAMLLSRVFGLAHGTRVWAQATPARACAYVPAALLAARAMFKCWGSASLPDPPALAQDPAHGC